MEELEGPSRSITFFDIKTDTVSGEMRLPEAKVVELQELIINTWLGRRSCFKRDLQSLINDCIGFQVANVQTIVKLNKIP